MLHHVGGFARGACTKVLYNRMGQHRMVPAGPLTTTFRACRYRRRDSECTVSVLAWKGNERAQE